MMNVQPVYNQPNFCGKFTIKAKFGVGLSDGFRGYLASPKFANNARGRHNVIGSYQGNIYGSDKIIISTPKKYDDIIKEDLKQLKIRYSYEDVDVPLKE